MLCILAIRLLLAYSFGSDLGGITNPQLEVQFRQQSLEPARMPTGFYPHTHFHSWCCEVTVELFRFLRVLQSPLSKFSSVGIHKRNLLEARVVVTSYNDHLRLLYPSKLWWLPTIQERSGERSRTMIIIGCDYHPSFQQIAFVDTETGELQERRLQHREEAEKFYRDLAAQGMKVRVGMEASGHARWFERLLAELQLELWIGDAAEISTKRVRKQKRDRQDAQRIIKVMLKENFPQDGGARGDRFQCGKQVGCYLGLVPLEKSSGNQRRLGHITKQGNSLLRFLLVEAAQVTARSLPEWRSKYVHLTMRRGRKIAKVAMARKLAVRMYWMLRKEWDYERVRKFGSHTGKPGSGQCVKENIEKLIGDSGPLH